MSSIVKKLMLAAFSVIFIGNASGQGNKTRKHMQAKGTFEVKILPVEGTPLEKEAAVGRMTIDKTWTGGFNGSSKGTMITGITEATGSMAYVAMEKVEGTLNGKKGSFYFTHNAIMQKGNAPSAFSSITVVTGSGTEGLTGLSGNLTINIDAKGAHSYTFDYELP